MKKVPRKLQYSYNTILVLKNLLGEKRTEKYFGKYKEKVKQQVVDSLFKQGPGVIRKVDCVENLDEKTFKKEYFDQGRPVVFKGAAKNWPCFQKWSLDYFEQQYKNESAVMVDAEGLTGHNLKGDFKVSNIESVIKDIKTQNSQYLRFSPLIDKHEKLSKDLDVDWLNQMRGAYSTPGGFQLFIGGKEKVTHLHNAMACNLFVMVSGEKKWRLYPTRFNAILDPPPTNSVYNYCPVDVYSPDLKQYPGFDLIDGYDVHLEPGDIFYNPPFMWHHVTNLTDSIGVGFRFNNFPQALKSSATLSVLRWAARNPPFWKTLFYTAKDINLIYAASNGTLDKVLKGLSDQRQKSGAVDKKIKPEKK